MKIISAEFAGSAFGPDEFPQTNLPEIAFVGRSNVGKSSLINSLVHRKKLARTSSTPGKTRRINFYKVNDLVMLVDLPGYGYTKVPQNVSREWRKAIDRYFSNRLNLKAVYQLIDIRHDPTNLDVNVSHWLRENQLLGCTILTKADKLSRSRQLQSVRKIREKLNLGTTGRLLIFSAVSRLGREEIWSAIQKHIHED